MAPTNPGFSRVCHAHPGSGNPANHLCHDVAADPRAGEAAPLQAAREDWSSPSPPIVADAVAAPQD